MFKSLRRVKYTFFDLQKITPVEYKEKKEESMYFDEIQAHPLFLEVPIIKDSLFEANAILNIPDLSGKTAIITGASSGIGKVSALEMARKNCRIVFACRNKEKTEVVIKKIKEETGNENLEFIEIDMMSLASVKQFTTEFISKYDKLDILLNNAGIYLAASDYSKDGIDAQLAVNHVAHHYLTLSLLPLLKKSDSARIVTVSSELHRFTSNLHLDKISTDGYAGRAENYSISKLANILFTRELTKRLKNKDIENIYANCNHPGVVATDVFQTSKTTGSFFVKFSSKVLNTFSIKPEVGALTQLYLCTSPDIEKNNIKGQYYVPTAKLGSVSKLASSEKEALELWEFTEKLIKEKIPDYPGAAV